MICEQCKKEGLKSRIVCDGSSSTLLGWDNYYDEDGNFHCHNPNIRTTGYVCSNKHYWTVKTRTPCVSCSYGREEIQ